MTSATTRTASGAGGRRTEGRGWGLVTFASILLALVGCFNLMYGIAAVANSDVFTASAHYVFGSLHSWGWATLIVGVLQLLAAAAVLMGNQLARWFGVAVLGLNAIAMMFFIPAYPFWALVIIALDVVAIYGLCAYGSPENADAVLAGLDSALGQEANADQRPRPGSAGGHRATV
ncbi:MAG TPA: hypothetical protein VGF54_22895 [Streptosporangiaceae bacterium]